MTTEDQILQKLNQIELKLNEQNLLQKSVLSFSDACTYLEISASHLYKLTSTRQIPHFCPQGKKLYFNRTELDEWLQRNRCSSVQEISNAVDNFTLKSGRASK